MAPANTLTKPERDQAAFIDRLRRTEDAIAALLRIRPPIADLLDRPALLKTLRRVRMRADCLEVRLMSGIIRRVHL